MQPTPNTAATQTNPMDRYAPKVRPVKDLRIIGVFTLGAGFLIAYTLHPFTLLGLPLMIAVGCGSIRREKNEIPYLWSGVAIAAYTTLLGVSLIWFRWSSGVLY
jgi:hypothetical protein